MTKRITVNVVAKDIANGNRGSQSCPIARALRRHKGWSSGWVGTTLCGPDIENDDLVAKMPPEAIDFVDKFDAGKLVEPFRFQVSLA